MRLNVSICDVICMCTCTSSCIQISMCLHVHSSWVSSFADERLRAISVSANSDRRAIKQYVGIFVSCREVGTHIPICRFIARRTFFRRHRYTEKMKGTVVSMCEEKAADRGRMARASGASCMVDNDIDSFFYLFI